jgi:photosystem II stability/assembly factor-like uncharacterized protein
MASGAKRTLYVGTDRGLFQAEGNGSGYEARLLGLDGRGAIRSPVVIDYDDPERIYAPTVRGGVFRSEDGGATWREINEGITYKETWSIVQHPLSGDLYVGTGPTSMYKSSDRGDTWTDCGEPLRAMPETKSWTFPGPPYISHVKGLDVCPDDPDVVVGAIEEGWVIRSQDGGKTWQNIKEGVEFDAHSVTWAPDDPSEVFVTSGKGCFRGVHGGDYFEPASEGLDRRYLAQLVVHRERPDVLFTAGAAVPPPMWRRPQGADAAFYRSADRGRSWERLTGGLPELIVGAPRATAGDPAEPAAFLVGLVDGSVWLTENSGESFRQILGGLPPVTSLRVAPS